MATVDISGLSNAIGISQTNTWIMIVIVMVAVFLLARQIKNNNTRKKLILGTTIGLLVLIGISGGYLPDEFKSTTIDESDIDELSDKDVSTDWQDSYEFLAESKLSSYENEIANTDYYDYDHPAIKTVANKIALESNSAEQAIEKTVQYVYDNVDYVWGEADNSCFDGTAPNILLSGQGQCDTQSITVISILRKMGIAARPVGGCIVNNPSCRIQAIFQSAFGIEGPKYTDLDTVKVNETVEKFSRGQFSEIMSRQGGLHAWLIAWVPEEGWVPFEATTGRKADTNCYYYHVEIFPENENKEDICVSNSYNYAKACQLDDLDLLTTYGEGLIGEVSP